MRKQTRDRLRSAACQYGWEKATISSVPSSGAGSSQAVRQRDGQTAYIVLGWTPRPALLPLPGFVWLPRFPDCLIKPSCPLPAALPALFAFAQTQLALLSISWRGQVNFAYLCRACPTNPVLNTSPYLCLTRAITTPTRCSRFLLHLTRPGPITQALHTPTQPGAQD
jgi:hypothetical protein